MNKVEIKTNNYWHNFVYGYELTDSEKSEFDYIDDIDCHNFIRYKGQVIDTGEIFAIDHRLMENELKAWHGYQSDSYFSGIVVRYSEDYEQYQIGTYIS